MYLGFPGGSVIKNPPPVKEMWVRSLGQEDPLEKEMATHFSILAWRIPWTEEPGCLQSRGLQRVGHDWATKQQQRHVSRAWIWKGFCWLPVDRHPGSMRWEQLIFSVALHSLFAQRHNFLNIMYLCIFQLLLGRELFLRPVVDLNLLKWTLLDYLLERIKVFWIMKNTNCMHHCLTEWAVLHSILLLTCVLIDNTVNQSCNALAAGSIWVIKNLVSGITLPKLESQLQSHMTCVVLGVKYYT